MTSSLKNSLFCAFCVLASVVSPGLVAAQNEVTFSVSPSIFDMTANPGETFRSSFRVINGNPYELRIYIDVQNFKPRGEEGLPSFIPLDGEENGTNTFGEWITTERELVIAPEATAELPLTINVPQTAEPGGHFAAVLVRTNPAAGSVDATSVQTAQVISSLLFLRVTGDILETASIRSFRTTKMLVGQPSTNIELRIENKGNVHIRPQGEIKIYNMWGTSRGVIPVNQETLYGNILPHSIRKFNFAWSSDWRLSDIGRYKAVTTLAYGIDARQFMTAETAFWIIPWKALLLVLTVVGGFFTLLGWGIKIYIRHMLALSGFPAPTLDQSSQKIQQVKVNSGPGTKLRRRTVSIMAPFEAGILDLRSRLSQSEKWKEKVQTLSNYIKSQPAFFGILLATLLFLALVTWFVSTANDSNRGYSITVQGENGVVTTVNESDSNKTTKPVITIINHTNSETVIAKAKSKISNKDFSISSDAIEVAEMAEQTVIVYEPEYSKEALLLSRALDGVLLSAAPVDEDLSSPILLHLGSDMEPAAAEADIIN